MSTFRPTRRFAGRSSPRGNTLRPVEWIRHCDGPGTMPANTTAGITLVFGAEFDDFTRPTVVRVRGELVLYVADITLGADAEMTYGITIVNPGEATPDPLFEARGNRWLWWGCTLLYQQGATVDFEDGITWKRIPYDVKSMRKRLVDGSSLQLCMRNEGAAKATVGWHNGASTLVKE